MSKVDKKKPVRKESHPHSLRRWINVFFIVFILAIISFSSLLYFYAEIFASIDFDSFSSQQFKHGNDSLFEKIIFVQHGLIGLTIFILLGVGALWAYMSYWIITPIIQVTDMVEQIGLGQLDHTAYSTVRAPAEIQRISETINDFSVNFQEILLFVWNQAEASLRCLEDDENNDQDSFKDRSLSIDSIKKNMLDLQKLVSTFAFYDVHFDNKRVYDASQKRKAS